MFKVGSLQLTKTEQSLNMAQFFECLINNPHACLNSFCFRNKALVLSWTLKRTKAWCKICWISKNSWTAS